VGEIEWGVLRGMGARDEGGFRRLSTRRFGNEPGMRLKRAGGAGNCRVRYHYSCLQDYV